MPKPADDPPPAPWDQPAAETGQAPPAPEHLSARAAALWADVLDEFALSPAEQQILAEACSSLDRADQAAAVVAAEGVTTTDRYGSPKTHPAVDVEARSRTIFARLIGQLGVRITADTSTSRHAVPTERPGPKPKTARRR